MRKHWTHRTVQIWAWLSLFPWNIVSLAVIHSIFQKRPFLLEKAMFPMHPYFVYKHNLPFFSVMYSISHELCFHIKEAHIIIRILTLVRNPRHFWGEQEVMSITECLVFYCPKEPWSTAKVTSQLCTFWSSPGKKNFGITYSLGNSSGNLLLFVYSPRL